MPRLPIPGSDKGIWGGILNEYLTHEHNEDGTHKTTPISRGGTGATSLSEARKNLQVAPQSSLDKHTKATTNVHGIEDTTKLETECGAQYKVDAHAALKGIKLGHLPAPTTPGAFLGVSKGGKWTAIKIDTSEHPSLAHHDNMGLATDAALSAHTSDTNNPHQVTKAQVGLSNVTNDPQVKYADKATQAEAEAGVDDTKWMTPLKTKQAIDTFASAVGEANTASNLGSGTGLFKDKAGVDLRFRSLVAGTNLTFDTTDPDEITLNVATSGDMLAATYDPQGIEADVFARANHTGTQAISTIDGLQSELDDKATIADLSAHTTATTNVHGIADTAALETQSGAQAKVDAHADNATNHGSGTTPSGQVLTADGTGGTTWTTPSEGVSDHDDLTGRSAADQHPIAAITDLQTELDARATVAALSAHTSDTNNPHQVTKAQVGLSDVTNDLQVKYADKATQAEAEAGVDDTKWMTPLKTKQAIDEFAAATGEVNTASNVGTGSGLFKEKIGADLRFKSLVAGSNVTFDTTDPDEITINASGNGGTASGDTATVLVASSEAPTAVKNVAQFVCDGVDDEVEITQALASLPPDWGDKHRGRIELSAGGFWFGSELQLLGATDEIDGLDIAGTGPGTIIYPQSGFNSDSLFLINDGQQVVLRDLALDGLNTEISGLSAQLLDKFRLQNVTFKHFLAPAVVADLSTDNFQLDTCQFHDVYASVKVQQTTGTLPGRFSVSQSVSTSFGHTTERDYLAEGVRRVIEIVTGTPMTIPADQFDDIASSRYRDAVNALADVGIVSGVGGGDFAPHIMITRAQTASYLANMIDFIDNGAVDNSAPPPATGGDHFDDIESSTHRDNINRLAEAGIIPSGGSFNPAMRLTREALGEFTISGVDSSVDTLIGFYNGWDLEVLGSANEPGGRVRGFSVTGNVFPAGISVLYGEEGNISGNVTPKELVVVTDSIDVRVDGEHFVEQLTQASGAVVIDMTGDYYTCDLTANPVFSTTRRARGRSATVVLKTGGSSRTPTWPDWGFVGEAPAELEAGATYVMTVTLFGNDETDAIAAIREAQVPFIAPNVLAAGHSGSPFLTVLDVDEEAVEPGWPVAENVLRSVGWLGNGSKLFLGQFATTSSMPKFLVVDTATKEIEEGWPEFLNLDSFVGCMGIATSPDDEFVALGLSDGPPWYSVVNTSSKEIDTGWEALSAEVRNLAFSPDGSLLAMSTVSGTYAVVDTTTKQIDTGWPALSGAGWSAVFSPDGSLLVIGHDSGAYTVIDVASKTIDTGWPSIAGSGGGVAFSPDGTKLAVASSNTPFFNVVDVASKTIETGWPAVGGTGRGVAWSKDGSLLAVAHNESPHVTVFDVASKTAITEYPALASTGWKVAFAGDRGNVTAG